MAYLAQHLKTHQALDLLGMAHFPDHWNTYGAWRLMAELSRRHPGELNVVEGYYPAGGTLWFLVRDSSGKPSEHDTDSVLLRLNETGHVEITHGHRDERCPIFEDLPPLEDPRLWTTESIFSPNLRDMVADIERCLNLKSPSKTPSTVDSTVGWRVIAAALGATVLTKSPMSVSGVLYDGVSPRTDLIRLFAGIAHLERGVVKEGSFHSNAEIEPDARNHMATLFALEDSQVPNHEEDVGARTLCVIDLASGVAHFRDDTLDLMNEFRTHGRDIDNLAWEIIRKGRASIPETTL